MDSQIETVIKENIAEHLSAVKEVVDDGGQFFLKITGNSMLPFLRNGSDIAVLSAPLSVKKYDVVFYVRDGGGVVLHRIVKITGDFYDMCGDNQVDIENNIRRDQIIAVMNSYIKNGRAYSCKTISYKIKSVFWVKTRILRKLYRNLKIKIKHLVKPQ